MRVTLNLATRPFADLGPSIQRLRIAMGVLALLAILLGLGLHAIHRQAEAARAHDHSLDGQIAHVTQEQQSYRKLMYQPDNVELLKQAAVLNQLIDEKTFSWTLAMEDLETVLPGGVQVTALEPARQKDGHISVKLRVVGPRNRAVDLVRNLEHSRRFLLPRIVGENAETNQRPGQNLEPVSAADRVDFDLVADYNPATAEERKASQKTASKKAAAENESSPPSRATRPMPLPAPGVGRPPYVGRPNQSADRPIPIVDRPIPSIQRPGPNMQRPVPNTQLPVPPIMKEPNGRLPGYAPNQQPGAPK